MSGYAAERQAIEARLGANFTAIPIRYENAPFRETQDPYCALFIRRGQGNQITLGNSPQLHRWAGLIVVQVFVPEAVGSQPALAYADTIAAIFDRQEFSVSGSGLIRCRVAHVETVGARNGWYQLNVVVPYIRDKSV